MTNSMLVMGPYHTSFCLHDTQLYANHGCIPQPTKPLLPRALVALEPPRALQFTRLLSQLAHGASPQSVEVIEEKNEERLKKPKPKKTDYNLKSINGRFLAWDANSSLLACISPNIIRFRFSFHSIFVPFLRRARPTSLSLHARTQSKKSDMVPSNSTNAMSVMDPKKTCNLESYLEWSARLRLLVSNEILLVRYVHFVLTSIRRDYVVDVATDRLIEGFRLIVSSAFAVRGVPRDPHDIDRSHE